MAGFNYRNATMVLGVSLALATVGGCKRGASSDAPDAVAPTNASAPPAPLATQPTTAPTTRPAAGRAVPEPGQSGRVIINGTGPGSPGTR